MGGSDFAELYNVTCVLVGRILDPEVDTCQYTREYKSPSVSCLFGYALQFGLLDGSYAILCDVPRNGMYRVQSCNDGRVCPMSLQIKTGLPKSRRPFWR